MNKLYIFRILEGHLTLLLFVELLLKNVSTYKNPYHVPGRTVNVHLFEWKWVDIADECERFLGPKGFGGVQISPPNENLILWTRNRPWWERYQSMSYALVTRSGDEIQLADMLRRCNAVGVRVYVDAIINHMSTDSPENIGTAGNNATFQEWYYPGVPYTWEHFNWPHCVISGADYQTNATRLRNCELVTLKDLNQTNEYVREKIVNYMNKLIGMGVAGFRIDAAKHMWPEDLGIIYNRLHNLNTDHGFPIAARPYIYQDVADYGGDIVLANEYTPLGVVTELKAGLELSNVFRGQVQLKWLHSWGPPWGLMAHSDAYVFIENHDSERNQGTEGNVLTYKQPRPYKAAIAFMLAHSYGEPQVMSSFHFTDIDSGPPMDSDGNISSPLFNYNDRFNSWVSWSAEYNYLIKVDDTCGNGWVCQHRWRQIYAMVAFRNAAANSTVQNWWDNGSNQISFCRGNNAFIAFNNEKWSLNEILQTCLPAGTYCDVISGNKLEGSCQGKAITVDYEGRASIQIAVDDYDMMLAIHVGPESRLSPLHPVEREFEYNF